MKLKYFTVERHEKADDIISRMRREFGSGVILHSYSPLIELGGNLRILELRAGYANSLTVKIDGPEFILKELQQFFIGGGRL